MGCCFSCIASGHPQQQPMPIISAPPPTQSSISMEEEEKVKEVVVVQSEMKKDNIVKQLLLKQSPLPVPLQPRTTNIRGSAVATSPLKQRRPSRTHSFSGDLSAVVADPSPSRRHIHSGSYKIVQQSSLNKDNNHPGNTSGRRLQGASLSISQRSPSMRRTSQLSPMKGRSSNKRLVNNGNRQELKKAMRKNGSADKLQAPSVSLECFIFL